LKLPYIFDTILFLNEISAGIGKKVYRKKAASNMSHGAIADFSP